VSQTVNYYLIPPEIEQIYNKFSKIEGEKIKEKVSFLSDKIRKGSVFTKYG
jgi:hypothetical protein